MTTMNQEIRERAERDAILTDGVLNQIMRSATPGSDLAMLVATAKGYNQGVLRELQRDLDTVDKPPQRANLDELIKTATALILRDPLERKRKVIARDDERGEDFEEGRPDLDAADDAAKKEMIASVAELSVAIFDLLAGDFRADKITKESLQAYVEEALADGVHWFGGL